MAVDETGKVTKRKMNAKRLHKDFTPAQKKAAAKKAAAAKRAAARKAGQRAKNKNKPKS